MTDHPNTNPAWNLSNRVPMSAPVNVNDWDRMNTRVPETIPPDEGWDRTSGETY